MRTKSPLGMWLCAFLALLLCLTSRPSLGWAQEDDLDDILGGFEEEDETFVVEEEDGDVGTVAAEGEEKRFWDLTGSVSLASSVNYLDHDSVTGTRYTGLQKLRTRLNLQLDLDLPYRWKARFAGYGFYDSAYRLNGRGDYTNEVLDQYEWEVDFQEFYLQGKLTDNLDLKVGRQIVNWGRSESLRVLDVLNPLDNREPGLADIEDLRLPVAMARLDYYWREWTFSAVAIPELRFDKNPVVGSDFLPVCEQLYPPERQPANTFENFPWAGRVRGIFHGWDLSLQVARYWSDRAYVQPPNQSRPLGWQEHSQLTMVGSGGNYTVGSWLFKGEVAYIDGVDYTYMDSSAPPATIPGCEMFLPPECGVCPPECEVSPYPHGTVEKSRVDLMGGIEYYGITETTIALEVVDRHINEYERRLRAFDAREDELETALRVTSDFLNARLHVIALGVIFGERAQDGSIVRLSAEYELRDALIVGGGILLYQNGDPMELSDIDKNDRIFFDIDYSF